MSAPGRPGAKEAGPELRVLDFWEESAAWLADWTNRWPKTERWGLVARLQDHALELLDELVIARWWPDQRAEALEAVNRRLERMRYLVRHAARRRIAQAKGFEGAMRRLDETGRMVHGWRVALGLRPGRPNSAGPQGAP